MEAWAGKDDDMTKILETVQHLIGTEFDEILIHSARIYQVLKGRTDRVDLDRVRAWMRYYLERSYPERPGRFFSFPRKAPAAEVILIDSGSTDKTREVAASFGADVYLASHILPEMGERKGKGENLWKALYQLKGDIIIYIDADIKNIHPRFAYGLVAPIIYHPEIKYVKAFYDRPLVFTQGIRPSGGGRVTEILVRPIFSLFFPELTAIIQPLSGEYAVRREVLERIPFPVGYGVETSHLIDVYHRWGLSAFAQTDLDRRVHRNQETRALGKMAFGILQTILNRMKSLGIITDLPEVTPVLRQFQAHDSYYEQVEFEIREFERPPMIEVPAYRKKFGIKD